MVGHEAEAGDTNAGSLPSAPVTSTTHKPTGEKWTVISGECASHTCTGLMAPLGGGPVQGGVTKRSCTGREELSVSGIGNSASQGTCPPCLWGD